MKCRHRGESQEPPSPAHTIHHFVVNHLKTRVNAFIKPLTSYQRNCIPALPCTQPFSIAPSYDRTAKKICSRKQSNTGVARGVRLCLSTRERN
ncbi:hypothetical protein AOLI_G00060020 [Acnodon oligacanthus]